MEEIKVITILDDEKFLRQISTPVELFDKELVRDILKLETFCIENEVLAMASVQIGIPKRIIYIKNTRLDIIRKYQNNIDKGEYKSYNEAKVLINPVIIKKVGLTEYWENCASCLDYMGLVKRPYEIVIEYEDEKRQKKTETFTGFSATVLSHEMDHLDGILHMDIAEEIKNMPLEERKIFRKTHDYKVFSETGDYEELRKQIN